MNGVIIYGPQGCGKTQNAYKLAAFYGATKIRDDFKFGDVVELGALHLTNDARVKNAIQFADAMTEISSMAPIQA